MLRKSFRLLTFASALSASIATQAQDKIFLNNGTEVSGKVKEINARTIVYKREDAPEGPDYVLTRKEVSRIKYENGVEEKMIASAAPVKSTPSSESGSYRKTSNRHPMVPYGKNIVAFAPIQMTNESPAGVGLSFEHFVDRDNVFSIYVPVAIAFFNDFPYNTSGIPGVEKQRVYTYFYPGMKIYPGGSNRRVSYSVGPSFGLGFGTRYFERSVYDPITGYYSTTSYEDNDFKAGFLVNNGLNIQPTQALYVGLEFGLGIMYYSTHSDAFEEPLVQFQFKMGYRF